MLLKASKHFADAPTDVLSELVIVYTAYVASCHQRIFFTILVPVFCWVIIHQELTGLLQPDSSVELILAARNKSF